MRTFFLEKTASVLLFCFLLAVLGWKLFDARTALLIFVWVLNCKYFVAEPNGSHALAASMLVVSVLCFYLPWRGAALAASVFVLLLSLKIREEMIVPVLFVIGFLIARTFYRWRRGRWKGFDRPAAKYYWIAAAILFALMIGIFNLRPNNTISPYYSMVMRTEFAGTYVNRTGLRSELPGKESWTIEAWDITYKQKLPGIKTDLDVIRLYPREELANIIYNVKITPKVASAMFLAFDRTWLMAVAFLLYLISFVIWPGPNGNFQRWRPMTREFLTLLIVWGIGVCLIVALICLLYISARHYVQLIPVEIIATTFMIRFAIGKLLPLIRPSVRVLKAG